MPVHGPKHRTAGDRCFFEPHSICAHWARAGAFPIGHLDPFTGGFLVRPGSALPQDHAFGVRFDVGDLESRASRTACAPTLDGQIDMPNHMLVTGHVADNPTPDSLSAVDNVNFTIASGKAGAKTGRINLRAEAWGRTLDTARPLRKGQSVAVGGRLAYRNRVDARTAKKTGAATSR